MTLFSQFKNKWWLKREEKLRKEFSAQEAILRDELIKKEKVLFEEIERKKEVVKLRKDEIDRQAKENELYEKLVFDRRSELEKSHKELKEQIRILEAKAKPDQVWVNAYTAGFNKGFDLAEPFISQITEKLKIKVRDEAIQSTVDNLDSTITKRINEMKQYALKDTHELLIKKKELEERIESTQNKDDKLKLLHYKEAIEWILNADKKDK